MSLPAPGSPTFVPLLLAYLAEQPSLRDFRPDPVLFSTILLSLIVAKGGLIVDVETAKDGDTSKRAQIKRVTSHIAAITCGVFGRTTHHAHLDDSCSPSSLPHYFLVPPRSHTSPTSSTTHVRSGSRRLPSSHTSHGGRRYVSAASHFDPPHPRLSSRQSHWSHSSSAKATPSITPKASTLLGSRPITSSPSELEQVKQLGDAMPTLPEVLILTGLEETDSPVWLKLVDILLQRKVTLHPEDGHTVSLDLPLGFFLIWVRDAQNTDHPSYLIDQFLSSTIIYAPDITAPPPDILSSPLIPPTYLANMTSLLPYTHVHPPLQIHISNLICAVSAHPRLRSTITSRVLLAFTEFVRAHRLLASSFRLPQDWDRMLQEARPDECDPPPGTEDFARKPETKRHVSMRGFGLGGGKGGVDTWGNKAGQEPDIRDLRKVKEDDEDGEQWYATPDNVAGVWQLCMRHRVKGRGEMDEITWVVKRSAVEPNEAIKRNTSERKRIMADKVLDELLLKV